MTGEQQNFSEQKYQGNGKHLLGGRFKRKKANGSNE
jgi:hypothetical protein